jgi:hypothetical protein
MTILTVKPDAISVMYDPNLLVLAQDCINTARSALEGRESVPEESKELVDKEAVTALRNHLLNLAKSVTEHAAGCLHFYEMRGPRDEANELTEQLDRVLLNTLNSVDKSVFRGLLLLLNAQPSKYVSPTGSKETTRTHLIACAVVDAAVSSPGKAVQVPSFEHGRVDMKSKVADVMRSVVAAAPAYRAWFRLEKSAIVRPYGKDSFEEYNLYSLTFQEPADVQKSTINCEDED